MFENLKLDLNEGLISDVNTVLNYFISKLSDHNLRNKLKDLMYEDISNLDLTFQEKSSIKNINILDKIDIIKQKIVSQFKISENKVYNTFDSIYNNKSISRTAIKIFIASILSLSLNIILRFEVLINKFYYEIFKLYCDFENVKIPINIQTTINYVDENYNNFFRGYFFVVFIFLLTISIIIELIHIIKK